MCLEGCKWYTADNVEVLSSEYEYQYEKLSEHGKADKADQLLDETPVEVMKWAEFYIPQEQENSRWQKKKEMVMLHACQNKFNNCSYAREVLLNSKSELAECTQNKEWGMGLDQQRTMETLPEFWPGKNLMGKILKKICSDLLEDIRLTQLKRGDKCKVISPINQPSSKKQAM